MRTEIFSEKQKELMPYIAPFKRSFYLAGTDTEEIKAFLIEKVLEWK
jgi:hypothetical protein